MFYFDKKTSNIIKGIALIYMFIHHFFTFPNWWDNIVYYEKIANISQYICMPFKICVSIYAFLTGYLYFTKEKSYKYSVRKILELYMPYWGTLLVMIILMHILHFKIPSYSSLLKEIIGFNPSIMCFCWYVSFYAESMLLLPIIVKVLSKDNVWVDICISYIVIPVILVLFTLFVHNNEIAGELLRLARWLPVILTGYLFCKYKIFEKMEKIFNKNTPVFSFKYLIYICIMLFVPMGRYGFSEIEFQHREITIFLLNLDIVYVPVFLFALIETIKLINGTDVGKWADIIIGNIGKQSMLMWFIHCMFFNVCGNVLKPILYMPHNPILVLIWGLAICYGLALVYRKIISVCYILLHLRYKSM